MVWIDSVRVIVREVGRVVGMLGILSELVGNISKG